MKSSHLFKIFISLSLFQYCSNAISMQNVANGSSNVDSSYQTPTKGQYNPGLKYIQTIMFIRANFSEDIMKKYPPEVFAYDLEKTKVQLLKEKLSSKFAKTKEYIKNNPKKVALTTLSVAATIGALACRKNISKYIFG